MNEQKIVLDISKSTPQAQVVKIGQGDASGTTIKAAIYDNGVASTLMGMSARFCMRNPGGATYVRDSDCTVSGNEITYVVDEEHCASIHGKTDDAYFELVDGETVYSTSRFTVIVLRSAEDEETSPAESWDNNFDEWLEGKDAEVTQIETRLIDSVNSAVSDAEDAMQHAVSDTEEVIDRAESAIDAMGDISELAVPLMSADTRGGAKLEAHGGLALRDGALGIGSLVQESDGYARGGLAEVTAKGHAEQVATTGKNLLNPFSSPSLSKATVDVGKTFIKVVSTTNNTWSTVSFSISASAGSTYTLSIDDSMSDYFFYLEARNSSSERLDIRTSNSRSGDGHSVTLTTPAETAYVRYTFNARTTSSGNIGDSITYTNPQLELGSTATEYEPYTGGAPSPSPDYPQEIQVVRGRNLLDATAATSGKYLASGGTETSDAAYSISDYIPVEVGATYITSGMGAVGSAYYAWYTSAKAYISATQQTADGFTLTAPSNAAYVRVSLLNASLGTSQLELGSTPSPYVPYGHVGMEVRDPDTDELISCTALPLPSRGWVASLPDGTADSLTVDGAGKCEWVLETWENIIDDSTQVTTEAINSQGRALFAISPDHVPYTDVTAIDTRVMANRFLPTSNQKTIEGHTGILRRANGSTTDFVLGFGVGRFSTLVEAQSWLSSNPVTVLYPLATPIVEDCGYVDMPAIPSDCAISIPELDALGIRYFVDDTVTQYGREIYARVRSEYADRLEALEAAVADLVTA